jgi:hypothetical protein
MQALTVAENRLPEGCALRPVGTPIPQATKTRTGASRPAVRVLGPDEPPINPWVGTDRQKLGDLRRRIDGFFSRPLPDAVRTRGDELELRWRLAEGVAQGYTAIYQQRWAKDLRWRRSDLP